MHRDPAADADSDRADLRFPSVVSARPDADTPRSSPSPYAEITESIDDPFLDRMNEAPHVTRALSKVKNQVADPLPWTMVGVSATSAGFDDIKARIEQLVGGCACSSRVNRRMFQQPYQLTGHAFSDGSIAGRHRRERFPVGHEGLGLPDLDLIRISHCDMRMNAERRADKGQGMDKCAAAGGAYPFRSC